MAWTYGFFNSVNGDRLYNAQQMSEMFKGLITSGVYESVGNKLAVQPNNGMTIQIAKGRGWFNNHWVDNATEYLMTLEPSDVTINRYCAVCIRVNDNDDVRSAEPYIKYGEFATEPVKPEMERTDKVNEYCLAYIYIGAGVTEITAKDIEDTRHDTYLCGYVRGLIDQIDANTLFTQYDAVFKEWFNGLVEYMNEDIEAKLTNDVLTLKGRNLKTKVTIDGNSWVEGSNGYTQIVTVNGVTPDSDIIVSPIDAGVSEMMGCEAVEVGYNTITFNCDNLMTFGDEIYDAEVEIIIFNLERLADITIETVRNFDVTDDGNGAVTISD